jgi:DNA repair protein RadD
MNLFSESRPIDLRQYQVDAVDRLRDGTRSGCQRQILVAPTAFGKTECAAYIIQQSLEKGARSWFVVDRIPLVNQTSRRFYQYGIDHSIIQADNPFYEPLNPVQIISAQTLARRTIDELPDLIVVDEAHCQYAGTLEAISRVLKAKPKAKVIGLTATPFTPGMADHWDGVVNGATVNQLLEMGFLTPLKVKACVTPDMAGAKKKPGGEYADEEAGNRGITIIGDVVQTWIEQTRKHFGGPVKTIVFSPSVKHGAELCRQFSDVGFNFQQISHLDTDPDKRQAIIDEFERDDSAIDGLVSCAVLTKGFDNPKVLCGISCRPYRKSFSSHIQEMGRVMRIAPGKTYGLWLCHSGNAVAFADDTSWLWENGVDSLSDAAKRDKEVREPQERVRKERFCGECGMQMQAGEFTCQSCGWEKPQRGEIQIVEGKLIDFDLSVRGAFQPRQGLRAECLQDPKAIWAAAVAYCQQHTHRGPDVALKWARGIWGGIYPDAKLPNGLWDGAFDLASRADMMSPEWALVDREVRRFRKQGKQRKAA